MCVVGGDNCSNSQEKGLATNMFIKWPSVTFSNCWGEGGHGYPEKKKSCWEVFNGNLAKMIRLIEENHGSK